MGGACGEGCREGGGGATSPDPREDSDPGSGSWIMSVSQGALGAGGVCVPGPQWVSDGAEGVFCGMAAFCPELRTEGPSGSYRQKSDSFLIRAGSHMVVVYVISVLEHTNTHVCLKFQYKQTKFISSSRVRLLTWASGTVAEGKTNLICASTPLFIPNTWTNEYKTRHCNSPVPHR